MRRWRTAQPTSTARQSNLPRWRREYRSRNIVQNGMMFSAIWARSSDCPGTISGAPPAIRIRELTLHFARALWKNGQPRASHHQAGLLTDRRPLPARPLCDRYLSTLRLPQCARRPVRELHASARSHRSHRTALGTVRRARRIEIRDSQHLFLKQSKLTNELRAWIDSHKKDWPLIVTSIAYKWLDEGLQDRGITRDLEWGFPVDSTTSPKASSKEQGVLRLVRRADRVYRGDQGMGRQARHT